MKTISKIIIGSDAAASVVAHIVRSGQWVESFPSVNGVFVVTVAASNAHLLPLAGDAIEGEQRKLPHGLTIFGKPSTSIGYPQCVEPEKFYLAVPVVSTTHVQVEDMKRFYDGFSSCWVLGDDCGVIFWWSCDADDEELDDDFPADEFSEAFRHMIRSFRDLGYNYLRLDSDGDEVTGLPVFEW